jgi:glucosamine kinase
VKIVVDCGGTKGDWRFIARDGSVTNYESRGFSPVTQSMWDLEQIIKIDLPLIEDTVAEVHYYGTGVHSDTIIHSMTSTLSHLLKANTVNVNTDLFAACRATCQDNHGIVAILGTGSASCLYDGKEIVDKIPSLGFIAGDEGAGSMIGKKILQSYFYREMPQKIQAAFEENYTLTREEMLENIYKRPGANSYLASFANFALTLKKEPFIHNIIIEEFDRFTLRHLSKYENDGSVKCHFVGSIAWFLKEELEISLAKFGLQLGNIIRKPIDQLVAYHHITHIN